MAVPEGDRIRPYTNVLIRLPSGQPRIIKIVPDTTISLGKTGSFPANALLHRPYNLTFDILDLPAVGLRVVSAEEVTRDILGGSAAEDGKDVETENVGHYDLEHTPEGGAGKGTGEERMRNNKETVDDPMSQKMSWEEIEELKNKGTGSGRDLIQALLSSHSAIHQKTPFALQKYTLRKTRKFLRRFTVHRLDVTSLTSYLLETKEPLKILELRNEHLGLMLSLGNVHWGGRWLIVDETGGLLVAAVAERLGLLDFVPEPEGEAVKEADDGEEEEETTEGTNPSNNTRKRKQHSEREPPPTRNTITLIHPNEQPNLSLLKYFSYNTDNPTVTHPLHTHLKTLNWLQAISPSLDPSLTKPETIPQETLQQMKGGKRKAYYRKLRRWEKMTQVVEDTHKGGFDGVLVAGFMDLRGVLKATLPFVRGSGQVVVYSPSAEPVVELAEVFSSQNKAAWIIKHKNADPVRLEQEEKGDDEDYEEEEVDPRLLLAPTIHSMKTRKYQVLPGRTHPVMTTRGGAEGFVFHATRVIPVEGRIEARGKFRGQKKRSSEDPEAHVETVKVGAAAGGGKRGNAEVEGSEEVLDGTVSPKKVKV